MIIILNEYSLKHIQSSTLIDSFSAIDFLFERMVFNIFGCHTLAGMMDKLKDYNEISKKSKVPHCLIKESKDKVSTILYGYKDNFYKLLKLTREFSKMYKSDIFTNVLVRINAIYLITNNHIHDNL